MQWSGGVNFWIISSASLAAVSLVATALHGFVMAAIFCYLMSFPLMRAVEYLEVKMGKGQGAG